ncbi:MAG: sigma factor, partial [Dolichospermum sp.]
MGLVHKVAHKMAYCCDLPLDDLIQIGSTGLIRAIERFDPEKKCKLSSIAVLFINGAILQF